MDAPADPRLLRKLRDLLLPGGGESGCIWAGDPVPLHDGYTPGARIIGKFRAGDRLGFGDQPEGDWTTMVVRPAGGGGPGMGWFDHDRHNVEKNCTDWAG